MNVILTAIFGLLILANNSFAETCDTSHYCFTSKQYPWGDVFFNVSLSEKLGTKGAVVAYTRLSNYPSEAEAMQAAIEVAEQLEANGKCIYIRGWTDF